MIYRSIKTRQNFSTEIPRKEDFSTKTDRVDHRTETCLAETVGTVIPKSCRVRNKRLRLQISRSIRRRSKTEINI